MDYIHINEKLVSSEDKRKGGLIRVEGKLYRVIGFELATNNFIVVEVDKNPGQP